MSLVTWERRLLAASAVDYASHQRQHGPLPCFGREGLIAVVEAAGLTGRGGGGFPTGRKMRAVAASGRPAIVIGNAAEGEPASAKDRALLAAAPHLVLDGLQLAAEAVGASSAYLFLPETSRGRVNAALRERRDRLKVSLVLAPDAFVAGEESAVVSAIEGGRALPRDTPRRVVEHGVKGAPTLVQNVETLAHVALLARYGAAWFREQGTADEPGTFLTTITGSVANPGVYEASYGTDLAALLDLAGGPTEPLQAALIGGFHGAWVPPMRELAVSRAGLRPFDASPGAGVIVALGASRCGLAASAHIAGYLAGQSAGQCGPCHNGLPRLADTLDRLARRVADPGLPAEVARLSALVTGRGACRHPDGTVRFVRSSMRMFSAEVDRHLAGTCTSGRP